MGHIYIYIYIYIEGPILESLNVFLGLVVGEERVFYSCSNSFWAHGLDRRLSRSIYGWVSAHGQHSSSGRLLYRGQRFELAFPHSQDIFQYTGVSLSPKTPTPASAAESEGIPLESYLPKLVCRAQNPCPPTKPYCKPRMWTDYTVKDLPSDPCRCALR